MPLSISLVLIVVALILITVDAVFLNVLFPTIIGLCLIICAAFVHFHIIPSQWNIVLVVVSAFTGSILALAMIFGKSWNVKVFGKNGEINTTDNEIIVLKETIVRDSGQKYRHYDVLWNISFDQEETGNVLNVGTAVVITKTEVGRLYIKAFK